MRFMRLICSPIDRTLLPRHIKVLQREIVQRI